MSPTAQRIALAEAHGYKWFQSPHNKEQKVLARCQDEADCVGLGQWLWRLTPDYLNDLNAVHELEKVLTEEQLCVYAHYLAQFTVNMPAVAWWDQSAAEVAKIAHATAAQRCEAILRTLNLWDDKK